MSKRIIFCLALLAVSGCAAAPDDSDVVVAPTPTPQPPPTDPRISELVVLVNELLDRMEVMNARLQKLESGAVEPRPAVAAQQPPARRPTPVPQPRAAQAKPVPVPPSARPATTAEIGEAYKEGLTLYGKGQIDRSRAVFQQVFEADPSGDLADNALYWIGETYFSTGKHLEASTHYQRIISEYPDQNKAPDAMLRMGMIQAKSGDLVLARKTLNDLVATYPYSTAAASAKAELKRIQY